MKIRFLLANIIFIIFSELLFSQGYRYFWTSTKTTETFDGGSAQWNLNLSTGANGADYNWWCIVDGSAESGVAGGNCGGTCLAGDWTMLIASQLFGCASGAAYNAGGQGNVTTDRSSTLNVYVNDPLNPAGAGPTPNGALELVFTWIGYAGCDPGDIARIYYCFNCTAASAMASWTELAPATNYNCGPCCNCGCDVPCGVAGCGGLQGRWTTVVRTLPVTMQNVSNLRWRWRWNNDNDGAGVDPSFAVDDIAMRCRRPDLSVISGLSSVNEGATTTYSVTDNSGTTVTNWTWVVTNGVINSGQGTNSIDVTWGVAPGGSVQITNVNYCDYDVATLPVTIIALPIELLSFNAKPQGEAVNLLWTTASETNNDFFTVERSTDAKFFFPIGKIKGAGNSSTMLHYKLTDTKPLVGISYYRLRQTDFNGAFSYSNIVAVNMKEESPLEIISIVKGSGDNYNVWIQSNGSNFIKLEIVDDAGKVIRSYHFQPAEGGVTELSLNTLSLVKGTYLLKASDGSKIRTKKFNIG